MQQDEPQRPLDDFLLPWLPCNHYKDWVLRVTSLAQPLRVALYSIAGISISTFKPVLKILERSTFPLQTDASLFSIALVIDYTCLFGSGITIWNVSVTLLPAAFCHPSTLFSCCFSRVCFHNTYSGKSFPGLLIHLALIAASYFTGRGLYRNYFKCLRWIQGENT